MAPSNWKFELCKTDELEGRIAFHSVGVNQFGGDYSASWIMPDGSHRLVNRVLSFPAAGEATEWQYIRWGCTECTFQLDIAPRTEEGRWRETISKEVAPPTNGCKMVEDEPGEEEPDEDVCEAGEQAPTGQPTILDPPEWDNWFVFGLYDYTQPLRWSAVPGATKYEVVHINHDLRRSTAAVVNVFTYPETTYPARLINMLRFGSDHAATCSVGVGNLVTPNCAAYYEWRVRAVNACGAGPWSDVALYGQL
jgi:hypothetical protein